MNWRKNSNYFKIAVWRSDSMKRHFRGFIFISLDSAFSWLFLLVCFDTKPLFLKVKKSKISFYIPVVSKNQNSLVFTFEKIFGSFLNLWRYFFRTSIHFNWLQSQNILQINVKFTWLVKLKDIHIKQPFMVLSLPKDNCYLIDNFS